MIFATMQFYIYINIIIFNQLHAYKVKVKTKQGVIVGVKETTLFKDKCYFSFYGIPYARAPIGRLRFKNPKPLKKFSKPFDASLDYNGACVQAHIVHKQSVYGQEDCLHLNIYTPHVPDNSNENLKAVIVWIHGYAFTSSFSHIYRPELLIDNDIIVVSLTHRIGVFGFLNLNETHTHDNMGLKDIIMGLRWIQKNIEFFGGDKNKITLMGSGSGGTFALLLFLTKHRKLFQKLIIHSGSMFSPSLFQDLNYSEREKLEREIKKGSFIDYRTVPADILIAGSNKIYSSEEIINLQRPLIPFLPLIVKGRNKSLVTTVDFDNYQYNENENFNIPILTGFTTQESISEIIPFIHNPSYLKSLGSHFKYMVPYFNGCRYNYTSTIYTSIAKKIIKRYFKNYPDISLEDFLKYTSDIHKYPIYKFIRTHVSRNNKQIFVYKFNYNGKFNIIKSTSLAGVNTRVKGTAHGDELCYIFKCKPLWEEYVRLKDDIYNRDRLFMHQITNMWANFAKYGNPTAKNYDMNVTWLPMTSREDNLLLFGGKRTILTHSRTENKMYTFWNDLYQYYYSPKNCKNTHDEL